MVGRDGIEPPTPGFSDRPAPTRKYAEVLYVGDLARRCSLVSIGSRWSITGTRGHRTGTPQRILSASRRSEEHTSELQSRPHLVCRLLLEKKKVNQARYYLAGREGDSMWGLPAAGGLG